MTLSRSTRRQTSDLVSHEPEGAPAALRLAPHVRACCTGEGHVVLLDLKHDRYIGIDADDASGLTGLVEEWPASGIREARADNEGDGLVAEMVDAGILIQTESTDRRERVPSLDPARTGLTEGYASITVKLRLRDITRFAVATFRARFVLALHGIDGAVARVTARRDAWDKDPNRDAQPIESARSLVAAYDRMRTFLFTAQNECLFDSFALLEFLALYRVFPRWVFGVCTKPFAAHCWLQHDHVTLNDAPENVAIYTRIMVV